MSEPKDFEAYAVGFVCASACTTLPIEEATARLNAAHPTGLTHGWEPSKDETFKSGDPNPCPCNDHPETHQHYLFVC